MTRRGPRRRAIPAALAALLVLGVLGCASGPGRADGASGPGTATSPAAGDAVAGELVVLAAASLQGTFTELAAVFEEAHPGVTVTLSFGGSSALARQLLAGAPADLFAAASAATMADAAEVTEDPVVFARNTLEIAVPPGNPGAVSGLADLADPARLIALCAVEVPCGAASARVLEVAGLAPAPDTYEADVTATLTKVVLGEVDAALVYRTDVLAAGDAVESIPFPEAVAAVNDYPVAVLTDAPNPAAARAFVALLLGNEARAVLVAAGFAGG
ncbi:molybdate ABC transporter substrate-binding protein [Cellulomonas pakistanensis]|uniref:Molybdate-binding protein n=1 Tax=Cellulomonas pakistanensis TaxID=992287 RepID=A0A919U450_9CELL|nr:molybdate ABC transporter substrate-binding protein [Cellulomonas pakistanensis]GIG34764.1 molybdate-binding protein [Cellulomonas pakistanensis]